MSEPQPTPAPSDRPRARWETPRIVRHGSVKRLVRGASGILGDPGAAGVGKRRR